MNLPQIFAEARRTGDYGEVNELIPYAKLLGIRIEQPDAASLRFVLPYQWDNVGNVKLPAIHGGVIAGLLENAATLHLLWAMESTTMPKPIDGNIDYLRSGRAVDTFARGVLTRQGRRVACVRVDAWQEDRSRPIAVASAHFLIETAEMPGPNPPELDT